MMRKRRGPGLRRSIGTGVTTPLAMRFVRMRPTIETETSIPSRARGPRACACPTSDDQAILEVGTKDKDTAALSLLVTRAIPIRRSDGYLHRPHAHDATALQRSATSSRQSGRAS